MPGTTKQPTRWIIAEKRGDDLVRGGELAEGQVDPGAIILVMEPVLGEDWVVTVKPHDYFVELVEVVPPGTAAPGETVTARVRVAGGSPACRYRLVAVPTRSDVRIIGKAERLARPGNTVAFRFTSLSGGKSGIEVSVNKID